MSEVAVLRAPGLTLDRALARALDESQSTGRRMKDGCIRVIVYRCRDGSYGVVRRSEFTTRLGKPVAELCALT